MYIKIFLIFTTSAILSLALLLILLLLLLLFLLLLLLLLLFLLFLFLLLRLRFFKAHLRSKPQVTFLLVLPTSLFSGKKGESVLK